MARFGVAKSYSAFKDEMDCYISDYMDFCLQEGGVARCIGGEPYSFDSAILSVDFYPTQTNSGAIGNPSNDRSNDPYNDPYNDPSKKTYLIVPSLFNSNIILDFKENNSLLSTLRESGDVLIINWHEHHQQITLSDYANEIARLVSTYKKSDCLQKSSMRQVHLVGHCIGGNLAMIALAQILPHVERITLLNTPFDYSHLADKIIVAEEMDFFAAVRSEDIVPKLYTQLLFFLLFPEQFSDKLGRYFLSNSNEQKDFLQTEYWLHSGIAIPNSIFFEILDEVVLKNGIIEGKYLNEDSLGKVNIPIDIVSALKDKIAPANSSVWLKNRVKKAQQHLIAGGHISYLVNNIEAVKKVFS